MSAVRPKAICNLKMGHHPLYRQLCADEQLEYDARHAGVFGCNDFVASILKTLAVPHNNPNWAKESHVEEPQAFCLVQREC